MGEHDATDGVERAGRFVGDEVVVGSVNVGGRDVVCADAPVVRVVSPYDRLQTHRVSDIANAVLYGKARQRKRNKFLVIVIFWTDGEPQCARQCHRREDASRLG